jgi:hypothetical protein
VQNLSDAVSTFKADNPGAVVGLYAEVPQNTFTWTATSEQTYNSLNPQYAAVAALVDYYSPSLYNYGYDGTASGDASWNSAAVTPLTSRARSTRSMERVSGCFRISRRSGPIVRERVIF